MSIRFLLSLHIPWSDPQRRNYPTSYVVSLKDGFGLVGVFGVARLYHVKYSVAQHGYFVRAIKVKLFLAQFVHACSHSHAIGICQEHSQELAKLIRGESCLNI